jgi:hypothetical protein
MADLQLNIKDIMIDCDDPEQLASFEVLLMESQIRRREVLSGVINEYHRAA